MLSKALDIRQQNKAIPEKQEQTRWILQLPFVAWRKFQSQASGKYSWSPWVEKV